MEHLRTACKCPPRQPCESLGTLASGQTFLPNGKKIGPGQALTGTVPASEDNPQATKRRNATRMRERERERERERHSQPQTEKRKEGQEPTDQGGQGKSPEESPSPSVGTDPALGSRRVLRGWGGGARPKREDGGSEGQKEVFCVKAYSTQYSQAVSHPSTNRARPCLASEIRRDRALSGWYGRRR